MDNNADVVYVGQTENICVMRGEPVPEGREVRYSSEHSV